jgi:predicted SprT family Zn-dependent metalloprotease
VTADAPTETPAGTAADEPTTRAELLDRAAAYAETVPLDVDLDAVEWAVSERAKRRAGCCRYDADTGEITVVLTWDAYREFGWDEFTDTVRHELVHAWAFQQFGESGHGERFRRKAREVDAPRHCRSFTDGRLELVCLAPDCDWRPERHRASKPVREPASGYRCGDCGGPFEVRHVASDRTWRTNEGYRRAREALGDDW